MKKIIAFGASSSLTSINKQFATYVASLFENKFIEVLDLNDFELPIFSTDFESEKGIPESAHDFYNQLLTADLIIISFAEHNGSYTAAFKNIFDWISRINGKTFLEKKMLLLATSPGPRGAATVLEAAKNRFPFHGALVVGSFSLSNFNDNFQVEKGITNEVMKNQLLEIINSVEL